MNASRTMFRLAGARLLPCALVLVALGGPAREGFAQSGLSEPELGAEFEAARDEVWDSAHGGENGR